MTHLEGERALIIKFNRDIVEVITGDSFFDLDDEAPPPKLKRAIDILRPLEDAATVIDASDSAAR